MSAFARSAVILLPGVVLLLAACDDPRAHGEQNTIVAAVSTELWTNVEGQIRSALQPPILTVTEEATFHITHQDPEEAYWGDLRRFRQVLAVGTAEDVWVQEALDRARPDEPLSPPEIIQVDNVWARGQRVTVVLLPDDRPAADALDEVLEPLHVLLDQQFRDYATRRMYVSGRNVSLADSLDEQAGFALDLPRVYRYHVNDSVFRFRNDNPSPGELIREIAVTWRSPLPETVTQEELVEWRRHLVEGFYPDDQEILLERAELREVQTNGIEGVELQAAWESPPDAWPAGGPFTLRALRCPDQDRLYLLDAWLYAPGREKYEYMIQLETIMNTFRCGD